MIQCYQLASHTSTMPLSSWEIGRPYHAKWWDYHHLTGPSTDPYVGHLQDQVGLWDGWEKTSWWANTLSALVAWSDPLQWRHNERDGVSDHQPRDCLFNRLFRRRSKETSKLHVTGLCVGNSPVTDEFSAQRSSNAANVSIWWRHHGWLR